MRIPFKRINELIEWYLKHQTNLKIKSILKYKAGLKNKIIEDKFDDLDTYYRGMLQIKYNLSPDDFFDKKSGRYKDFKF